MAAIDHSAYAPSSPALGLGDKVFSTFYALFRAVRVEIASRQTLTTLKGLSPRQLDDIGLDGADLNDIAHKMAQSSIR